MKNVENIWIFVIFCKVSTFYVLGRGDIVVNCIHPGSHHSKICQSAPLSASEAATSVASTALLEHPCEQPRGRFIWHDLHLVDWTKENTQLGMTG